jgi:hypothetical protein
METLLQFLEQEREKLFQTTGNLQELLGSLTETLRTLSGPLRNCFTSSGTILSALKPDADKVTFTRPELQSLDGEVQANTSRLINLINNLHAIRNRYIQDPHFIEFSHLMDIEQVQAEIKRFLEELYGQNAALVEASSENSALARQKRRDIEELLEAHVAPWFSRLRQLKTDEYLARLRPELKEAIGSPQAYAREPQRYEALIKEKCARIGLPFDLPALQLLMNELEASDEQFEQKIRSRYAEAPAQSRLSPQALRRKYVRVLSRYLTSIRELERLGPILQSIYHLFQPKPALLERFAAFLSRLAGHEPRIPRKDIEFTYIVSRDTIQHHAGSLETLMERINVLEKTLLRLKGHLRQVSLKRMDGAIDQIHPALTLIIEEGGGLVQWLGKPRNRERLAKVPAANQRTFHQALTSMQATLIINQERLAEIARIRQAEPPKP